MKHDARDRITELREKFVRALKVFARMPDPDGRFRTGLRGGAWPFQTMREPGEYGWHPTWLKEVASPAEITAMDEVLGWLAWLRRLPGEGDGAVRRIIGWATDVPMAVLAWRERCSVRTIFSRIDKSMAKVLREFHAIAVEVAEVEEPPERHDRITSFTAEKPAVRVESPDSLLP